MNKITLLVAFLFSYAAFAQEVIITSYVDSPCPGAEGRVLELYVDGTVDLTDWKLQRQSNGGGYTTDLSLTDLGSVTDAFVYITNDLTILDSEFNITSNAIQNGGINSNGNDAFQVVNPSDVVIDRFGEENIDGAGTAWEHTDSFYQRNSMETANAGNFEVANWTFGALNALIGEGLCNGGSALSTLVELGSFEPADTVMEAELVITEIFPGQEGDDLTEDWFEITNTGSAAYIATTDGDLFYDDDSADPADAVIISGITEIQPGATVLVLVTGDEADVTTFTDVWGSVIDLTDVAIGTTDGSGLGAGGDGVTIWLDDPMTSTPIATASYPDTAANDGQSYDVDLGAFSVVGNDNGAVETIATAGDTGDVPNIGSPGNGLPLMVLEVNFEGGLASVAEDGTGVNITIAPSEAPMSEVTVEVALVTGGTAVEGTDFNFPSNETITFPAGSSDAQTLTLSILDDEEITGGLYFVLQLQNAMNATIGAQNLFSVYILEDDFEVPQADSSVLDMNFLTSFVVDEDGTAEITAYDPQTQRLFVTNATGIEVLDFSDPTNISSVNTLALPAGTTGVQSVAVKNGILAAALSAEIDTDNGFVMFSDTEGDNAVMVEVGALPDMLTFTPDGTRVLVANEGQPNDDYTIDPEGSISIIDVSGGFGAISQANVTTLTFNEFDDNEAELRAAGVRIFGPGATVSQDLEPEYIAVSTNSGMAYVTLQENNAYAIVDITNLAITDVISFGLKDHSLPENTLDTSDETDFIFNASWPIKGMYMPDAVSYYEVDGTGYIVTANEGDARDYDGYAEERKLDDTDYLLDPAVFSNIDLLQLSENLGDINTSAASGDANGDGLYEEIHVFGGRSFSIFEAATGIPVYDSGNDFETITAADPTYGAIFNASNDNNNFKNRSDNKGPEPEGVLVQDIDGTPYAFVILERIGGVMVYDVSDPANPIFLQYLNSRNAIVGEDADGDLGPEGIVYVSPEESPTGAAMLVISNEVSATLSVFSLDNIVLGIDDVELGTSNFNMYPNPASDNVSFSKPSTYTVYDLLGRTVGTYAETKSINVSGLTTGTYLVTDTAGTTKKLIVQ